MMLVKCERIVNKKSALVDGFWSSRGLNYRIDVADKIGSFSSGTTISMVVKNGTKKTIF